ncbi:hypothetical protein ACGFJ7_20240 [Actinoplanes sp. NPDC048988]|uniref:hypothetical protein n=1 Tax=Actinoplanes sp. NPDC048988 TaxID=3363901 RepID=UPI0037215FE2
MGFLGGELAGFADLLPAAAQLLAVQQMGSSQTGVPQAAQGPAEELVGVTERRVVPAQPEFEDRERVVR